MGPGTVESLIFALSIVTGPLLSRTLGDAGRGDLAAVLVPTQLVGWGIVLGVPYASAMLVKRHPRSELLDGAWALTAIIALPVCTALFFLAPAMLDDHPPATVAWFRVGLVGSALAIPAATALHLRLITRGASAGLSAVRSIHLVANSLVVVGLAVIDRLTLRAALAAWILSYVAARVAVIVGERAWPRARPFPAIVRDQLLLGRSQAVLTVATISLGRIDQVVLSFLGSAKQLGIYVVAATAAQVSLPMARGFADVVLPDVFARPGKDISGRATAMVFGISATIGVASAASAPWLVPALFGEPFRDSVPLLWLLIPGQVLFNTAWVISARHLGGGSPRVAARAISLAAAVNLVFIGPTVSAFGPEGAAILTSACQALYLAGVWAGRSRPHPQPGAEGRA